MDELRMIRELLPEQRPPARATEQARARLDELIGERRPHRARALAIGLTAAAAAAAVTAVAIPMLSGDPAAGPVATPAADPLSAKEILLLGAEREERAVAPSGKYWHVRTVGGNTDTVVGKGAGRYHLERRWVSETWTSTDPPETLWDGYRQLGARPATAADKAAWVRDGSPSEWDLGPGDTVGGEHIVVSMAPDEDGQLGRVRLDELDRGEPLGPGEVAKLPTDPAALKKYLLAIHDRIKDAGPADRWLFSWASQLLVELPARPAVRAAALRVIAELPNVRSQGRVSDPLGREGIGIVEISDDGGYAYQLVVDPGTGQLLARVGKGAKNGYVAVLDAGWTDRKPHVPAADIG